MRLLSLSFIFIFLSGLPILAEGLSLTEIVRPHQVLFLGERHTSEIDHRGQLEILKSLKNSEARNMVVVLEMFDERSPSRLSKFGQGLELEPDFWSQQWGHPYELYKPIFDWCREESIELTHLRPAPSRTKSVREGDALKEFRSLGDFYLGPPAYRDFMADVAAQHLPQEMSVTDSIVDKYFLIQCFWDEYMSWRVAQILQEKPDALLVVLVGHGHLHSEFGIPRRLKRRRPETRFLTVGFEKKAEWAPDLVWEPSPRP